MGSPLLENIKLQEIRIFLILPLKISILKASKWQPPINAGILKLLKSKFFAGKIQKFEFFGVYFFQIKVNPL